MLPCVISLNSPRVRLLEVGYSVTPKTVIPGHATRIDRHPELCIVTG